MDGKQKKHPISISSSLSPLLPEGRQLLFAASELLTDEIPNWIKK